ncbi:hypothetical protein CEUSTIGMA_g13122.t1 [Chlamydomonas eustigma]|uniref:Dienelactone hydrolase domain-containing protein n=1 Tax=Chlamydomonas eustigma TaxID=1157962 RepID=A0A250XRL6_9CHLO|nr:hypothetical protein CEUSTIGMA_g13122.t1 [Chlamydomonas eustigma]|eukprot:GAX85708.1 hypothetical protein CEUSTIGMA_g13122.t1 [Chlamydomonas eustigma]
MSLRMSTCHRNARYNQALSDSFKRSGATRRLVPCRVLITESEVLIDTPTGAMRTSLFKPSVSSQEVKFPGVIVYSEIYQVTGPIERICRRIASEGYVVAAGDVYHEYVTGSLGYTNEGTDRGNTLKVTKPIQSHDSDTTALVNYLLSMPECNGRIGTFGLCLGGGLAFRATLASPHVRAAACHFATDIHNRGLGPQNGEPLPEGVRHSIDNISALRGEAMMVWGTQDPHIPAEGRTALRDALLKAGATFTWAELNANHAFLRDDCSKGRYDAAISNIAYEMTFELFTRRLTLGLLDDGLTKIPGPPGTSVA